MTTSSTSEAIVLTGCGWVTPFASGSIEVVLNAGLAPEPSASHVSQPSRSPARTEIHGSPYWAVPDALRDEHAAGRLTNELKRDKAAWMTAIALELARLDAGLEEAAAEPERVGLAIGSALAGQLGMIQFADEVRTQSPRFVSPIHFPQTVGNYLAGALARGYGIRGASVTLSSGAASGLDAIAEGCDLLACGAVDVVYAGGTDRLSKTLAEGLAVEARVPSRERSRGLKPAARLRFPTLSEGACLFVLERSFDAARRGAQPLATVIRSGHGAAGALSEAAPPSAIVSTAACRRAGAVFVEHWIGRCQGASGAAAIAAAIGAAGGLPVPVVEASDPAAVRIERFPDTEDRSSHGDLQAVIIADTDGAHASTLELLVHTRAG